MGFVAMIAGVISLVVTLIPGTISLLVHFRGRDRGRGSWPIFIAIALTTALLCAAAAGLLLMSFGDSTGAPTSDEYTALILGFVICLGGPGLGMSLGSLALLKRAPGLD